MLTSCKSTVRIPIKNQKSRTEERWKILSDHRQDGNVAVDGIGNLAR